MGDLNIILLVLLVWTFTAVCKAYDSLFKCEDVTGHVGVELNLTCRVSYKHNTNCMMMYKFMNKDKDTRICRENFKSVPCEQLTSISCPYTANEVMITTFKVIIQTKDGTKSAEFTVNIAEAVKEDDTVVLKSVVRWTK
ncbi:hypothetical protein IRJ41_011792 [Triplophysa rosa]|uniref:Uncharacterized protein n=1 Tax=Triplophysa rosa TaxID=992332 RepID=A0A9W7TJ64_TRIRA|nr:hypothetical protein IRJ41_011792 [Triplophysa rosa]